jgi:hypothetical protein
MYLPGLLHVNKKALGTGSFYFGCIPKAPDSLIAY